jgi:hypothetical protein
MDDAGGPLVGFGVARGTVGLGFDGKGAFAKATPDDLAFESIVSDIDFLAQGIGIVACPAV